MTNPTDDQIAKLPKWAQNHIETLQRRLDSAEQSVDALNGNASEYSAWYYREAVASDRIVRLPKGARLYRASGLGTIDNPHPAYYFGESNLPEGADFAVTAYDGRAVLLPTSSNSIGVGIAD